MDGGDIWSYIECLQQEGVSMIGEPKKCGEA